MKRQALFATFWSAGDILLRQGVQFGATLVLARLLAPADFGVLAMIVVFTGIATVIADAGLSLALVQRQDTDLADESSVFWFNLGLGSLLALLLVVCAPLVAAFYRTPQVAPLARFMALGIVASAAGSIHFALLSKRLEFRLQAKAGGIAALASGAVAIGMALAGYGVWALATQTVLMSALTTTLLWRFNPWRPAFVVRRASLAKLMGFGLYQLGNALMDMAYTRLYSVAIGRLFGARQLGFYASADSTRQLPASFLGGLISRVALPMFARADGDAALYRRGVQLGIRMMMLLNAPVVAAMVVLARPLVETLFGRQWLLAAPLLQVMALAMLFYPLHAINLQALMGRGHARLMFRLEVAKKLLGVALLAAGARYGMAGLVWSQVLHSCLCLGINAYFTRRWFGYGAFAQLSDALPTMLCAGAGACVAGWASHAWPLPMPWGLLLPLAAGGASYLALLAVVGRGTWRDAKALFAEMTR